MWNVIACHNMPRLPRDLQRVTTSRSRDNAIRKNTQSDTSEVLRPPRKITMEGSKVLRLPRTMQLILKAFQKYCACQTKLLSTRLQARENVRKCHACHARRHFNLLWPSKRIGFAAPPIDPARPKENQRFPRRQGQTRNS